MLFETHKDQVSMREIRDAIAMILGTEHEAIAHIERWAQERESRCSPTSHLCTPEDGMLIMLSCFMASTPSSSAATGQMLDNVAAIGKFTP